MYAISISMVEKVSEIVGARVKERIFKAAERDIIANFEKGGEGQLEE